MTNNVTRTFLVPDAKLPTEFGLTETVGSLPEKRPKAFVARGARASSRAARRSRSAPRSSPVRDDAEGKHRDLTVWQVTTEVSDEQVGPAS